MFAIAAVRMSRMLSPARYRAWRALLAHDADEYRRGISPVRHFDGIWRDVAREIASRPDSFSQQILTGKVRVEDAALEISNFLDKTGGFR